jgi:hypothetical protein
MLRGARAVMQGGCNGRAMVMNEEKVHRRDRGHARGNRDDQAHSRRFFGK